MRIFLLRLLIASWMIPFLWLVQWPILALLAGPRYATESTSFVSRVLWTGDASEPADAIFDR